MKKAAFLLIVLILVNGMCAIAEDSFKVLDEVAFALTKESTEEPSVYLFIEVENTTDELLSLDFFSPLSVVDQQGVEHSKTTYMFMYPESIKPGEKGFIVPHIDLSELNSYHDIADYSYELEAEEADWECDHYETVLEQKDGKTFLKLTNNTNQILYDPELVLIYRASDGKLLHVETDNLYGYGIPAGMSAYVDMTPRREIQGFFEENGIKMEPAEHFAYVLVYIE